MSESRWREWGAWALLSLTAGCEPSITMTEADWAYQGERGPTYWGTLAPAYRACGEGAEQSPIDVRETEDVDLPPLDIRWVPSPGEVEHNGHWVEAEFAWAGVLQVGPDEYELGSLHFHVPGESRFFGRAAPGEIHFVLTNPGGRRAYLVVQLLEGETNAAVAAFTRDLPLMGGEARALGEFDAKALLPKEYAYLRYDGSLCAPPCTEGVPWLILAKGVHASPAQLDALREAAGPNARPVQPTNERMVVR